MKVVYIRAALEELNGIADYLTPRHSLGAANVEADIRTAIDRLVVHPYSGRAQDEAGVRKAVSSSYRYRILYAVDDAAGIVQVLSILHPSRQS
ncbi:type II toxin-antitoxin system RelE/ParE family toxin [Methylobacterium sp. J-077]|uniref:type II toxin-antitoxin system RelE/ParE family toxin n=1 Tax=Methylobacterium sp. J-077 TaxID=2836656 RepID=UPI001FB9A07A|nr:type II toxin-antitoxin system RelE/ParE family toxin [Methylobacterium sp. J-077]MCJ2121658.1 type II toxin-antitoxin system RelE/ParE family toxin [Methylobacterium sp. J-077]